LRAPGANPLSILFRFPFSVATLLSVAALGLLLWATMGRFGPPEEPAPALGAGKMGLIANAARLLDRAGYQDVIALRYVETIIAFVGARLHAPAGLARDDLVRWLGRSAAAAGVAIDCAAVLGTARSAAAPGRARAGRGKAGRAGHRALEAVHAGWTSRGSAVADRIRGQSAAVIGQEEPSTSAHEPLERRPRAMERACPARPRRSPRPSPPG
jgi:hypothetical protein